MTLNWLIFVRSHFMQFSCPPTVIIGIENPNFTQWIPQIFVILLPNPLFISISSPTWKSVSISPISSNFFLRPLMHRDERSEVANRWGSQSPLYWNASCVPLAMWSPIPNSGIKVSNKTQPDNIGERSTKLARRSLAMNEMGLSCIHPSVFRLGHSSIRSTITCIGHVVKTNASWRTMLQPRIVPSLNWKFSLAFHAHSHVLSVRLYLRDKVYGVSVTFFVSRLSRLTMT